MVLQGEVGNPRSWSGSPAGLLSGLRLAGADAIAVDCRPPGIAFATRHLRVDWARESASGFFASINSAWGSARTLANRPLDGIVAIGSGYEICSRVPMVTFEDETVAQALVQPYSAPAELPRRAARRWQRRQKRIYERCRACCVGSDWAARSVRDDYGVPDEKVHIVGFGRNLSPPRRDRDWSVPRYIFIGSNWELKRGPAVVEAFAAIRSEHPRATLDLVGDHPPISAPGVIEHGRLSLASPTDRDRLETLLAAATCLVLPSAREAFGIAYLDAAAAGVPCVGTTAGGGTGDDRRWRRGGRPG